MSKKLQAISRRVQSKKKEVTQLLSHLKQGDLQNKYIYVSHHKCATQYTIRVLQGVCDLKKMPTLRCDWKAPVDPGRLKLSKFLFVQDHSSEILDLSSIPGRGFHVIRDPRDMIVSMYFSHRDSHAAKDKRKAEILEERALLPQMSEIEGLVYLMEHSTFWKRIISEIGGWNYDNPNFYETRYELLTTQPFEEFTKIFSFLDIEISPEQLQQVLNENSFDVLKKEFSENRPEAKNNHYRKGQAGDWQNHLVGEAKEAFKQHYGDLVVRLGYAKDTNW